MRAVDIVRRKRDGAALTRLEIDAFVAGVTARHWPDYQASALLMAIFLRGMNAEETAHLTDAMVRSGTRLDLTEIPGPKVDKHSTGGVGDKTSLVLAPLAAACGAIVPMMSGRGLGHTGGTLDKLEAIPGFRPHLSLEDLRTALRTVGCGMIGQTSEVAPADKILYALRDVTATVESIPLITASIMSKKIAEGIDALVLDVKCGRGAFMKSRDGAAALARSLVDTGNTEEVRTEALLTSMDAPLGRAVGNTLEVIEAVKTLRGEGPSDVETLSVELAARMVLLAGLADSLTAAQDKVRAALTSGAGLDMWRRIIEHQGGDPGIVDDPSRLPQAPRRMLVRADRSGYVTTIDAEAVGHATMLLGAGRDRAEHAVDHAVGAIVQAVPGEEVRAGDPLVEVHYREADRLAQAEALLRAAWVIGAEPPAPIPLLLEEIR